MAEVEPQQIADKIIGQTIVGLRIDYETEIITIELNNGDIDFSGDGLSMKVFDLDKPKLN
jgi:hypothetical protein